MHVAAVDFDIYMYHFYPQGQIQDDFWGGIW